MSWIMIRSRERECWEAKGTHAHCRTCRTVGRMLVAILYVDCRAIFPLSDCCRTVARYLLVSYLSCVPSQERLSDSPTVRHQFVRHPSDTVRQISDTCPTVLRTGGA